MTKAVLITGSRAAAALDTARDFVCAGWDVHLADSVNSRLARWSNLRAMHHAYPPPRQNGAAFRERIAHLVEQHAINLVVPTCEEVFHLAAPSLHQALGECLFAPTLSELRALHDKYAFAQKLKEWDLPAPTAQMISKQDDLNAYFSASRDWVFKPRYSRFGSAAVVAPDTARLRALTIAPDTPWMAQRCVHGEEVCFHTVAHHGQLTAFAAYASNWRLRGGACYAFEPLDKRRNSVLREIAQHLVQKGGLHGQFGFDAIFDAAGDPHIVECNPRATSGVHMIAGGGQLARAICGEMGVSDPITAPAYLAPAMVFFGLPKALAAGRIKEWRTCLSKGRDAISRPADRMPAIGAVIDTAVFAAKGLARGTSANAATTFDIEWNGEELEP